MIDVRGDRCDQVADTRDGVATILPRRQFAHEPLNRVESRGRCGRRVEVAERRHSLLHQVIHPRATPTPPEFLAQVRHHSSFGNMWAFAIADASTHSSSSNLPRQRGTAGGGDRASVQSVYVDTI